MLWNILCEPDWFHQIQTHIIHTLVFLIYLSSSFFGVKKAKKKENEREYVIVERVWGNKVERERESQQSLFSHILSWQHHAKRETAGIALMWLLCSPTSILILSLHQNVYSHCMAKCIVYSICSTCFCVCLCECIEYFFLLSFWYSLVSLEQIKQFFLRSLVIYCVHGSWPRCIFWNSTYGDPNAKRRKNRVGLFKRMEIHRKGKEFYPMCVVCTVYVYHIISLKELLSHCCIQNWHILLFLSVSLSLPTYSTLQAPSLLSMLPSAHPPSSFQFLSCKRRVFFHLLIRKHIHD